MPLVQVTQLLWRDGVCNPVTHVSNANKAAKRFGRGYKPRPALGYENRLSGRDCRNPDYMDVLGMVLG